MLKKESVLSEGVGSSIEKASLNLLALIAFWALRIMVGLMASSGPSRTREEG